MNELMTIHLPVKPLLRLSIALNRVFNQKIHSVIMINELNRQNLFFIRILFNRLIE